MIEAMKQLLQISRQMLHEIGREPTPEELAEKLGMSLERVHKVLEIAREPLSLDMPIGEEEDSRLSDFVEDDNAVTPLDSAVQTNLREATAQALARLTPREERIMRMRFGIGMGSNHTLEEVGNQFSVTRERIRQIEAEALRKLRHPQHSHKLRRFLDILVFRLPVGRDWGSPAPPTSCTGNRSNSPRRISPNSICRSLTTDSLAEGERFEPSVPVAKEPVAAEGE